MSDTPTRTPRLKRLVGVVAAFAVLGPYVGLLAFCTGIAVFGIFTSTPADMAATALFVLIYGLAFAHFVGAIPAVATAIAVATVAGVRGRAVRPLAGAAIGALVTALYVATNIAPARGTRLLVGEAADGGAIAHSVAVILAVLAGTVAAAACTHLTRRLQAPPQGSPV